MVSAIVLVEPRATEADEPVSKTDGNFRQADSGRRIQAAGTKEENPGRRCQGRWSKVGGEKSRQAGTL